MLPVTKKTLNSYIYLNVYTFSNVFLFFGNIGNRIGISVDIPTF